MARKVQFAENVVVGDSAEPAPKELDDLTSSAKRKKRSPTPFPAAGGPDAKTTMAGRSLSLMSELALQTNTVKVKTQTMWVEEAEANQAGAEMQPYEKGDRFVFSSTSKPILIWRVIVLLGAWFSVLFAPYEAAFHGILANESILLPIRHVVDAIMICDIFVTCNLVVLDERGYSHNTRKSIVTYYATTFPFSLPIDIVSAIPYPYNSGPIVILQVRTL
jgi:hypothetical protein